MSDNPRIDFALERIRLLNPSSSDEDYLVEIAWLYDRIVKTGSLVPVIDLAYELVLEEEFVGECVSKAMEIGYLKGPKRGSNGGTITDKALRQIETQTCPAPFAALNLLPPTDNSIGSLNSLHA